MKGYIKVIETLMVCILEMVLLIMNTESYTEVEMVCSDLTDDLQKSS